MKLKHVEVFNAIMVTGTVSGAARILNVTQPAITQTLQHAELQLGFQLFNRVKNRLVPTREALTLYPEIERLFQQLESVRGLARNLKQGGDAALQILIVPSLAVHLLPLALQRFRKKYPNVPLHIRTQHSHHVVTSIALREADVGILYGTQSHPAAESQQIATGYLVAALPKNHPLSAATDTLSLTALNGQPVIRIYQKDPMGMVIDDLCSHQEIEFTGGITVQTHHTALTLAEHGFGPAILDIFTAASCNPAKLDIVRLADSPQVHLSALWAKDSQTTMLTRYFVECVQAAAQEIAETVMH
jgi:DNA-binding transcriptional LysR family regulator